jgi:hypothetical protein
MSFFSLKIRPFYRGIGVVATCLWLTLIILFVTFKLTKPEQITVAGATTPPTTTSEEATKAKPPTEAEIEEGIDYELYGNERIRRRIGLLLEKGDASLLCDFQTDFSSDLKVAFGRMISREQREEPTRELIQSELLRHRQGVSVKAFALYEESFIVDRVDAIRLMDELLRLPDGERAPLAALAKYRRARLKMSLEDWDGLSDEAARLRLREIREDLTDVAALARQGSLDPAKVSENATYWLAYSRSMILPSRRLESLGEDDYAGAAETYLRMPRRGNANAVNSCLHLLYKLCQENNIRAANASETLRKLMSYYLASAGGPFYERSPNEEILAAASDAWLDLLAESKTDHGFAPKHIAIIQYRRGRWRDCQDTAYRLPATDPVRRLLLSRCNLRLTGELGRSRAILDGAELTGGQRTPAPVTTRYEYRMLIDLQLTEELRERVAGESGLLALQAGDFMRALNMFEQGRYGEDALYVAECLLPLDELKQYVDRRRAAKLPPPKFREYYGDGTFDDLEMELSSRLMRAGRSVEALEYVSKDLRPQATTFVLLCRAAERSDFPSRERADSYWRAALLIRQLGETLLHTPHGMSWTSGGGWYVAHGNLPGYRSRSFDFEYPPPDMKILNCGPEELRRVRGWESANMVPAGRSGRDARYAAFDLAIKAVALLPDNDPAGATILQYAGNLLKYREPKAAVPAYRLLVTRFPQTPYGQHAVAKKWFSPERPEPPSDILSR